MSSGAENIVVPGKERSIDVYPSKLKRVIVRMASVEQLQTVTVIYLLRSIQNVLKY